MHLFHSKQFRKELPELPAICTNLDKSLRKLRHFNFAKIAKAALDEIPNIKATWDFYFTMCVFREKGKELNMSERTLYSVYCTTQ